MLCHILVCSPLRSETSSPHLATARADRQSGRSLLYRFSLSFVKDLVSGEDFGETTQVARARAGAAGGQIKVKQ